VTSVGESGRDARERAPPSSGEGDPLSRALDMPRNDLSETGYRGTPIRAVAYFAIPIVGGRLAREVRGGARPLALRPTPAGGQKSETA
jgi:hypothetical protein